MKFRSEYDSLYEQNRELMSISETNTDLNSLNEEVICLYITLDEMIKRCNFNKKQLKILKMYMKGYTERDIQELMGYNSVSSVVGTINTCCNKILNESFDNWLNDNILWNSKKVETNYKKCSKCEEYLPATEKYFAPDKTGKYNLRSNCRKCREN